MESVSPGRPGKGCDSLNIQYVVDMHGIIRHVSGISWAAHDKNAISWLNDFMAFLSNLPQNVVVLADPGCRGLHQKVITTYTGRYITSDKFAFNLECTKLRQVVERAIGTTQMKWHFQQLKENLVSSKVHSFGCLESFLLWKAW